jgi:hypothetical protein
MRHEETYKPKLAPKTDKFKKSQERDSLSRRQYSNVLHSRSA